MGKQGGSSMPRGAKKPVVTTSITNAGSNGSRPSGAAALRMTPAEPMHYHTLATQASSASIASREAVSVTPGLKAAHTARHA